MTAGPSAAPTRLINDRIVLRRFTMADAADLLSLYADRDVMRYWSHAPWRSLDQARRAIVDAIDDYASGASLHYAIEHRPSGQLIGSCALYDISSGRRSASLGYLLAKAHWGRGYLSKALTVLLAMAFDALDLNRIEAEVDCRNKGSALALRRFGFREEACLRQRWMVDGVGRDVVVHALLRGDSQAGLPVGAPLRGAPDFDGPLEVILSKCMQLLDTESR